MNKKKLALLAVPLALVLASCDGQASVNSGTENDQNSVNRQLMEYQKNQPIPMFDRSQYRQTLIDVESAQVHGTATTSFFFNQGSNKPYKTCPSIGFPVPSTSQLTNPDQVELHEGNYNGGNVVIGQQEPNGAYTGSSSGTYVICVSPSGTDYVSYAEGFVHTEGGNAHWDNATNSVVLDGEPTVKSTDNGAKKLLGTNTTSAPAPKASTK